MVEGNTISNIAVVGLGKLGCPLALCLARKGFYVRGCDISTSVISSLDSGVVPYDEPNLQDFFDSYRHNFVFGTDVEEAVSGSDLTFVVVPTPSDESGRFSTEYIESAAIEVAKGLAKRDGFPIVVLTSTVLPGDTENRFISTLEEHSGKKCGVEFGVCYSPEFIALGSVVFDTLNPDFSLIGESDDRSGLILENVYAQLCDNGPAAARMAIVNAEITKLAINTFVTTKISYANMLLQLCCQIDGANIDDVTNAIGRDRRIGNKYLKGGPSYGGPCFPRDNRALSVFARDNGVNPLIAETTDAANLEHKYFVFDKLKLAMKSDDLDILIVGMSYKENTPEITESPAIFLAEQLITAGYNVSAVDRIASNAVKNALNGQVECSRSFAEAHKNADVVVLFTDPSKELAFGIDEFKHDCLFFDVWRFIDPREFPEKYRLYSLGVCG